MSEPAVETARLSPWWRHATILVMIAGFSVLVMITALTYTNAPPIPKRVVDTSGTMVFDEGGILRGQEVFLKHGLMEHGTLWGHGAYLGPDYTAEYLHRLAEICTMAVARFDVRGDGTSARRPKRATWRLRSWPGCSRRIATSAPPAP